MQFYFYPTDEGVNENLIFYMVEPGEELFLHYSLWRNVPLTFTMDGNTEMMDITLTKVVEVKDNSACNSDKEYNYIGMYDFSFVKNP